MTEQAMSAISLIVGNQTSDYLHEFTPPAPVANFHGLPRFSHTDDFALLFSSDPSEVEDYSLGLLFVACFVVSFFTTWGLILLPFKCLGPRYLGVLSGHSFRQHGTFANTGRIIFAFSAIAVMICSILSVVNGLTELETTADTIEATNQDVLKIHNEFVGITTNLRQVSQEAIPVRDQLVEFLNDDICPLQPGSATESEVRKIGKSTLEAMEKLANFIGDDLTNIDKTLGRVKRATDDVESAAEKAKFDGAWASIVTLSFFLVPSLLLVSLMMSWTDIYSEGYYCFTIWFLMPLFTLMVIYAYVATGFAALATEGNADFCSGGASNTPEGTIQRALLQRGFDEGNLYYDSVMFYSNQCQTSSPWGFLEQYYTDLLSAKANLDTFATAVDEITPDQLTQECGAEFSPTLQLLSQMQTYTSILLDSSKRSIDLISCDSIVPLYTSSVYDATCEDNIKALTWIFGTFFVISFFGMLMLMFRGACYPIWYDDDDEGKSLGYGTSEDDAGLQEEDSEYVDDSMVDTTVYQDEDATNLEEIEGSNDYGEGEEYEESAYEESLYTEERK